MNKWLCIAAVIICANVNAQVARCNDARGKVIFTDRACPAGFTSSLVDTSGSNVTEDQARQAREVYRRNAALARQMEQENSPKLAQQPLPYPTEASAGESEFKNRDSCVRRVESTSGLSPRQKAGLIASCHGSGVTNNASASNVDSCVAKIEAIAKLSPRQKATALAQCHGAAVGSVGEPTSLPSRPHPSVITNCDAAGCWDNLGGRYNKAAGNNYFRSDGKFCQQVGGQMQCH